MLIKPVDFMKRNDILSVPQRGIVVDNNDPKKIGRVKCTIPGLFEETDFDKLPWVAPWREAKLGGSPDSSSMAAPELESELAIEFPFKNIYFPFYTGAWVNDLSSIGLFFEDYPESYGSRDTQNTYTKINKAKRYAEFRHTSNTRFRVEKDGTTELASKKRIKFVSEDGKTFIDFDMVEGIVEWKTKGEAIISGDLHRVQTDKSIEQIGSKLIENDGSHDETILGGKKTVIGGSLSESIIAHHVTTSGGNREKTIALETTETYGLSVAQTLVLGSWVLDMFLGNHEINILAGNIDHNTLVGEAKLSNALAKVEIGLVGNTELSNLLASLKMDPAGGLKMESTLPMELSSLLTGKFEATILLELKAAITKINSGTSPVLSLLTDPLVDLITGAPHLGVPTVLVGP